MKTIAITNQKGGVGKTTTANALTAGLTLRGFNVLAVDLDGQGNLSLSAGADTSKPSSLDLLTGKTKTIQTIQQTSIGFIVPSSSMLINADRLITGKRTEYRLKESLEPVSKFDFCIIDTPPALGLLTLNALTASDYVIIPTMADLYSLQGITQLADTIRVVQQNCNSSLKVPGILLTMFNGRTNIQAETAEYIQQTSKALEAELFKATIRSSTKIKEAPFKQQGIFEYAPKASVTADYTAFVDEVLERIGQ